MREPLAQMISDFRDAQDLALDYLHGRLRLPLPGSSVDWAVTARRTIETKHELLAIDRVVLRKHGFGIEVTHPEFRIDFDYGPNGECDCFDSWRLSLYTHQRRSLSGHVTMQGEVSQWIAEAYDDGELIKVHDDYSHFIDPNRRSRWAFPIEDG